MMRSETRCVMSSALAGVLLALSGSVSLAAQPYPERPIRLVVPLSAGGSADIVGRVLAQKIGEKLGQQLVIDNRPGAGSIIGTEIAARAPADGYTLLLAGSSFTSAPSLHRKLPYDPLKDFAPITMPANAPGLLVAHPAVPARTVSDLIALARAKPGQINYASPGNGTAPHFAGALFNLMAKVDMAHIPYKGAGPAVTAVMAGESQLCFASMPSAITQVRQGRLRGIAVTGLKRSAAIPELPTVAESGLPGFESGSWQGLFAPAGTPVAVIRTLNQATVEVVHLPEVVTQLARDGSEPVGSTPDAFAKHVAAELAKWARVAKEARMHIE
jgi:tripartite-type tricarboxylate transporter receptor subunit TctC